MLTFRLRTLSLAVLCCATHAIAQVATVTVDSYVAAVVEYGAQGDTVRDVPLDIIRRNWANYEQYMEQAASQNVDIIVFPEVGLTNIHLPTTREAILPFLTPVPDPRDRANPCQDTDPGVPEILRNVSCAARRNRMYTVINLSEISACEGTPGCPADGAFFYNTNLAFDRNGSVVARYRKFNLFVEPGFDVTPTAELSTFDTDFGVRFGMFICFDILYAQPALRLVEELGVTDIAYSTAWFSELPYLTATQTQAAWAYAMDVNVLASGFNNPSNGNSGSGIYAGKLGALDVIMPITTTNRLLVRTVPKKTRHSLTYQGSQPETQSNSPTCRDNSVTSTVTPNLIPISINVSTIGDLMLYQDNFTPYTTVPIGNDADSPTTDVDICHGSFCCHFNVTTEASPSAEGYHYRVGVFDGVRNFAGVSVAGVQVCGLMACRDATDATTCGLALDGAAGPVFKAIHISGNGFRGRRAAQLPSTLAGAVLPLPVSAFRFRTRRLAEDAVHACLETTAEVRALLGFAIYGRVFDRDGPYQAPSCRSR